VRSDRGSTHNRLESALMKNLVMGFATNQDEKSIQIFTKSLRRVYSSEECDLVIITNRFEPYFIDLSSIGVTFSSTTNNYSKHTGTAAKIINRLILYTMRGFNRSQALRRLIPEISQSYEVLLETWHHPHFVRWLAYRRVLELNRHYNYVLLADVKDVVFQAPFFQDISTDRVSLFQQGEVYGKSYWDTKWYKEAWGPKLLEKALGKQALCIGTIAGPHAGVLNLVKEIADFFAREPFGRIEQAIFNYMVLNDKIRTPYQIFPNITGPITTLANEEAYSKTLMQNGIICRATDKQIIPVVHMYDRFSKRYGGG
jgi:hypothetical protein